MKQRGGWWGEGEGGGGGCARAFTVGAPWRQLLRKSKTVCVMVLGWAMDAARERERTREIDPKPPSQADRPLTEELCDLPLSSSEPPHPVG